MEPFNTEYATCMLGSPDVAIGTVCPKCRISTKYKSPSPLVWEWSPGSDMVGDFSWPDGSRVGVRTDVFKSLVNHFPELKSGPIKMYQDPKLKHPKRPNKRTKLRVWLPYEGPELVELCVEKMVPFLPETTLEISHRCEMCGHQSMKIVGGEWKGYGWDKERFVSFLEHEKRLPGKGLFVSARDICEKAFFRVEVFRKAIFCTDEARDFILERGFTNIDFLECGDFH